MQRVYKKYYYFNERFQIHVWWTGHNQVIMAHLWCHVDFNFLDQEHNIVILHVSNLQPFRYHPRAITHTAPAKILFAWKPVALFVA